MPSTDGIFSQFTPAAWGIWTAVAMMAIWWIRGIPERQRARDEGDGSLRKDLLQRVADLEKALVDQQIKCAEEQAEMRKHFDLKYDGLLRQFIQAQLAWAQAVPPASRSPEIDAMLERLKTNTPPSSGI